MAQTAEKFDSVTVEDLGEGFHKVTVERGEQKATFTLSDVKRVESFDWGLELETTEGAPIRLETFARIPVYF